MMEIHKKPAPENRGRPALGIRNTYEADLFSWVALRYMRKHNVNFLHCGSGIERRISEGVDKNGKYEDVAYHRNDGYYVPNDRNASHLTLMRRFVLHIRRELSMPLDELEIGRGYIIE